MGLRYWVFFFFLKGDTVLGHCKSLEPIWEQLGKKFALRWVTQNIQNNILKKNNKLNICNCRKDKLVAKMDATQNTVDAVEITGFPTLKLFSKETNNMIEFSGKI